MASDTKDKASNQSNYSEKNENALNENNDMSKSEGVDVPEEFQQQAHKLVKGATKAHLSHLRGKINAREDEMRDEEMSKKGKNGKMSMDDAPSSVGDY